MITAEWVGNALEHGLDDQPGIVEVALGRLDAGARLTVDDTGVGSSRGDWSPGFDLSLVSRLAAQLGGRIERSVDSRGSRLDLVLPEFRSAPPESGRP